MHEPAKLFATKASIVDNDAESSRSEDRKSKLETIITESMSLSEQPSKEKEDFSSPSNMWNRAQIERLRAAIKKTKTISDKASRWTAIASHVGASKKVCYLKYKELKSELGGENGGSASKSKRSISAARGFAKEPKEEPIICDNICQDDNIFAVSSRIKEVSVMVADSTLLLENFDEFVHKSESHISQALPTGEIMKRNKITLPRGRNMKHDEADAIREILFSSSSKRKMFGPHWEMQGFSFSNAKNLRYGLVQVEGGPCGVLAVVQAYVIRFLFDQVNFDDASVDWQNPDKRTQENVLSSSLAHILIQASQNRRPQIVLPKATSDPKSKQLRWVQDLQIFDFDSESNPKEDLKTFFMQHVEHFAEPKGNGLILFVLSVILSAGIDRIRNAMDTGNSESYSSAESGCLIGSHEYCTQELVNLLLCGHAVGNVFDNMQTLDSGPSSQPMILKGIPAKGTVGFLTLFESYNYIQVGSFLKSPKYNIWVICSESHYSVLFMPSPHTISSDYDKCSEFDLFYYDGLANQEETIRLTITNCAEQSELVGKNVELIPPLNLVIKTKWPKAIVSWNDTDPLL
ncbi:unnamed protein product [Albugo candida]|nr:unnamed protein product [Albugo candida]|eukprot:CCI50048.1 unnamed protein product [Albugo candida]